MSTSQPYHHGNLRSTLLEAAEAVVDAGAERTLSLRELARDAGVSASAPYKHFPTREALLQALAVRWMAQFVDEQVAAGSDPDPARAVRGAGMAYVRWAIQHPHRFAALFTPPLSEHPDPSLQAQVTRHTELLSQLARSAQHAGLVEATPSAPVRLWATVHGLATLANLGLIPTAAVEGAIRDTLRSTADRPSTR